MSPLLGLDNLDNTFGFGNIYQITLSGEIHLCCRTTNLDVVIFYIILLYKIIILYVVIIMD